MKAACGSLHVAGYMNERIETYWRVRIMKCQEETVTILLRLPMDVKEWIEKEAARTLAHRNSEIVRTLRQRMDAEQSKKAAGQ
jgi:hypothetical protein